MEFRCVECQTVTEYEVPFQPLQFVCPKCRKSYLWSAEGFRLGKNFDPKYYNTKIPAGTKATLGNRQITVTGSVTKQVYNQYYWEEYTLCDEKGEFLYLSQSGGNFILLQEIEVSEPFGHRREISHDGKYYRLYEKPVAEIVDAQGFFDEELPETGVNTAEYIAPPYVISTEFIQNEYRYYKGEHISRRDIKKAFPGFSMPHKDGIGIAQPFPIDFRNLVLTMCAMGVLVCLVHFLVYSGRSEQIVLEQQLKFAEFNGKQYTSPGFELVGGSSPLSIDVSAAVDNNWANLGVVLVDEATNDEIEASKDIEYYHGYTGGENWSEGGQSENFNICGVGAGKYHLVLTPLTESTDPYLTQMDIKVTWNRPSTRNIWMTLLFAAIFCGLVYFIKYQFEKKRWSESDYSEYG